MLNAACAVFVSTAPTLGRVFHAVYVGSMAMLQQHLTSAATANPRLGCMALFSMYGTLPLPTPTSALYMVCNKFAPLPPCLQDALSDAEGDKVAFSKAANVVVSRCIYMRPGKACVLQHGG